MLKLLSIERASANLRRSSSVKPHYEEMVRHRCRGSRGCCSEGSPVYGPSL